MFSLQFFLCIFIEQTKYVTKIQKQQPEPIAGYISKSACLMFERRKALSLLPLSCIDVVTPTQSSCQCFYINKYKHIQPASPSDHWHSSCIIVYGKKHHGTCVSCGVLKLDVLPSFNPQLNKVPILTYNTAAV